MRFHTLGFSLFISLLVTSCSQTESISSQPTRTENAQTLEIRNAICSATADTFANSKNLYADQCGGQPIDCDPVNNVWVCSSTVIGEAAPGIVVGGVAGDACAASSSSLDSARNAYAMICSIPLRDCDPVGIGWLCSSQVIGASAPQIAGSPDYSVSDVSPLSDIDSLFVEGLGVAAQWNELGLAAVRAGSARPTATTWQMFLLSTAMYDAAAIYTPTSSPYALSDAHRRPASEHNDAYRKEAVSQAAYHALIKVFPDFESRNGYFKLYLESLGYRVSTSVDTSASSQGYQAAMAAIDVRANDGSNSENDFEPVTSLIYPSVYAPVNSPDPISNIGLFGEQFDPNHWQPLRVPNGTLRDEESLAIVDDLNLNSFGDQEFLSSHWGAVTPFALTHGAQFRPVPPPMIGSDAPYVDAINIESTNDAAYRRQIEEVVAYSANLTDELKVIAEFWADGPRTESPPGHWNQIAHGVIERDDLSLIESTQLFFALNGALLDAGIATWEAKRYYDYIRPASAIRWLYQDVQVQAWGGPNKGTRHILGQKWSPYQTITFVTPPFPEYVSGHSTFSRAAAEVLTRFTGSSTFYDGHTQTLQDVNSDGEPDMFGEHIARAGSFFIEDGPVADVVLQWGSFLEAADEAGKSRLYGGIHIQDGDLRGRELGRKIGERAFERATQYASGSR